MVGIISAVLILVATISYIAAADVLAEEEDAAGAETKKAAVSMPEVSSSSYIVMSGSTSEVVLEKHDERKMQPGSITMLMTAMIVIDNVYDDDELSRNSVDITEDIAKHGDSFKEGESVSVGELLQAMLVGADEEAAEALASYSTSTRDIFVNEMNSKCMELGIMDTQFDNPTGEYSTGQYSTAKDLAVITQAAMRYQRIKDALSLRSVSVSVKSKEGERQADITSCDPLYSEEPEKAYKYARGGIGGELGDPVNASQFAAVAVKDDMELIVILMDSERGSIAQEAKGLIEYADTKVTRNTIVKKGVKEGYARIRGGASTRAAAYTETKGFAYVPPEGSEELIQTEVVIFDGFEAPMYAGDKVGEFRIYVADELKGTVDLVIKEDIPEGWLPSKIYISNKAVIILSAVLGLALLFWLRVLSVRKQRARRREAVRRQKIRELARKQLEIDEDRRRRDWNYGGEYYEMPPRTTDIRNEDSSGTSS